MIRLLFIGFLVVLWWVGLWNIIETVVQDIANGSAKKALMIHAAMVGFVVFVVYFNPNLLEHFV